MRVAVILPSYQEEDNIASVTTAVDRSLKRACRAIHSLSMAVIANVDSSSTDNTREIFKNTLTFFPKLSLCTRGRPGKGKNILFFLDKHSQDFDVFVTLDSDLKSVENDWLLKFLQPFNTAERACDFVWPLYRRSRFEGSTTNHFAYPLASSLFEKNVRQPIAGDFAFSRRIAEKVVSSHIPKTALYYGIDILFSIRALQYGRSAFQVALGYKRHKPSFAKLEYMFPQVVSAALGAVLSGPGSPSRLHLKSHRDVINVDPSRNFSHHRQAEVMYKRHAQWIVENSSKITWIEPKLKKEVKAALNREHLIDSLLWAKILAAWLSSAVRNRSFFTDASELLPFFVIRSVSFWHKSLALSALSVEKELKAQVKLINNQIKLCFTRH